MTPIKSTAVPAKPGQTAAKPTPNRLEAKLSHLLGARKGTIVVMRVTDGRLLAVVNPALAAARAISPGSVMKVPTLVAGWQEGVLNPHRLIPCAGPTGDPACWEVHGNMDLKGAISRSCSCYVGMVGRELGAKRMTKWWRKLGFGQRTGVDLPNEVPGYLAEPGDRVAWADTAVGEGPGILATPLQLVSFYGAIANGGQRWRPNLHKPKALLGMLFPVSGGLDLAVLRQGLSEAAISGSAKGASPADLIVAGKTGTASMPGFKNRTSGWFAGYAPANRPQIAIVVELDDAKGFIHAVPLAKQVFETWQTEIRLPSPS
ncbi:MAG: hypothetical protein H7338_07505 [Candidatus Sericytochromatia bacterium]|nr:hypothetical protein [Candidatus Sericytochromatia bacterium]